ncbi:unnamed protein product [Rangifer tarandus platyrhynchus]|uniref:Uncharacterized protein n=1 Tax=Rangifer tarandus platyrhynchus TaxID=3082113 RepID=A0ABN8YQS0_RANTA|nr:unnamed protein product [Rangifer tarandus platyrhynchus]
MTGSAVEPPPAEAGAPRSMPGLGRPRMPRNSSACGPQLLRLCSRAQEPQLVSPQATVPQAQAPEPVLRGPASQLESPPFSATGEQSAEEQRPRTAQQK